ncbi:MAG: hypothetical protein V7647_3403 [Acidobacteriota bacterium]
MIALLFAVAMFSPPGFLASRQHPPPTSWNDLVQIDGARSPELIPQWSVWGYVFRVLAGGPRQLPTSVLRVFSKE